jgi:hypothetical protein
MPNATGHLVTVPGAQMSMPRACCRCNQPGTQQLKSTSGVRGRRATRSIDLPYCDPCVARAKQVNRARLWLTLSVLGIACAAGALGFLIPFIPKVGLIGIALALTIVAAKVLTQRAGTTIDWPYGAWISTARTGDTTFFCSNGEWAQQFAASNNVAPVAGTIGDGYHPAVIGGIITAIVGTIVAFGVQPSVHVDNGGSQPLQIWIDGKKSIVAEPKSGNGTRPEIVVPFGNHVFGWSPVGAGAPVGQTTPRKVEVFGDHLLNPDSIACYYLDLSIYGTAKGEGMPDGPVALDDFYTFKHIDNWFSDNPTSVSSKSSGETRTAVKVVPHCGELAANGCSVDVRRAFMDCVIKSPSAIEGCVTAAAQSCTLQRSKK